MGLTRAGVNLGKTVEERPARDIIPLEVRKGRTTISSKLATVGPTLLSFVEKVGPWRIFYQGVK